MIGIIQGRPKDPRGYFRLEVVVKGRCFRPSGQRLKIKTSLVGNDAAAQRSAEIYIYIAEKRGRGGSGGRGRGEKGRVGQKKVTNTGSKLRFCRCDCVSRLSSPPPPPARNLARGCSDFRGARDSRQLKAHGSLPPSLSPPPRNGTERKTGNGSFYFKSAPRTAVSATRN